ncbi:methionyl-tRNA formyltransferase [Candidatus Falkowbacteria bacterium CG10_big_fil_rev_8_21_14_0_10_37_14]|uniref:Methionyl-tRNA formyltransferase n=1 Tax=Candidatus Falkowbacteria bacterium CG10_big_fil_rev_8_21_14_0_10_37_14 TaxID=1974561 RepID=A0A2M6WSM3_9BACT|nr:methionyl-tRNA formyltransferase [Candidatus Falkowbacteria bacterium]PIT95810.1 MAG: methionyl-tRNA formyltransferase [Candidatus Falkowbacteria bacterium CG10_big_fil_rev_8_21_14_0_10_37_14]
MSNKPLKIVFAGTPDFACPSLTALVRDTDLSIKLVITQPDKPSGRGLEFTKPAIKVLAEKINLPLTQPEKINQLKARLLEIKPDVIVAVAYSQLIPEDLLAIPRLGWINVHASLLPRYRGAGVIQAPILNNDQESGVTIMLMAKGLDTGPILAQSRVTLSLNETAGSLSESLSQLGGSLLLKTLKAYVAGDIKPREQEHTQSTYVGLIKKQNALIDWNKPAKTIEKLVRAMSPWPTAWTWLNGRQLKITAAEPKTLPINTYKVGKTFLYNNMLAVQCGEDSLLINRLKLESKNEVTAKAFINGHQDLIGQILG